MEIKITDNSGAWKDEIERRIAVGLEICGGLAEGYAIEECPVDTGRLRGSITHVVDGHEMIVGTNVEYGPYIEFGTGIYAVNGDGRKTAWRYKDEKGNWHQTVGGRPHPFIKPAIADHIKKYKQVLEDALKG